jgi:hypothetical protein
VLQRISQHPAKEVIDLTPRLWKVLFAVKLLRSDVEKSTNIVTKKETKTTIDISHLSIDQLYTLNEYVVDRIDELQRNKIERRSLRPGM